MYSTATNCIVHTQAAKNIRALFPAQCQWAHETDNDYKYIYIYTLFRIPSILLELKIINLLSPQKMNKIYCTYQSILYNNYLHRYKVRLYMYYTLYLCYEMCNNWFCNMWRTLLYKDVRILIIVLYNE